MADFNERFPKPEDFSTHSETVTPVSDEEYVKNLQRTTASNYSIQPGSKSK